MARRHRPQASRGHRHGRGGRRAAPAEAIKPKTQSAEQTEIPAQNARVSACPLRDRSRLALQSTLALQYGGRVARRGGSTPQSLGHRSFRRISSATRGKKAHFCDRHHIASATAALAFAHRGVPHVRCSPSMVSSQTQPRPRGASLRFASAIGSIPKDMGAIQPMVGRVGNGGG